MSRQPRQPRVPFWEDKLTGWFTPWLDLMHEQIQVQGKHVDRVRVVDQPPSDYLRWEIYLNKWNAEAGEDIRYLTRHAASGLHLPAYDFWIFAGLDPAVIDQLIQADDVPPTVAMLGAAVATRLRKAAVGRPFVVELDGQPVMIELDVQALAGPPTRCTTGCAF